MVAQIKARPVSVSATLGGTGTGSVTAEAGASAELAGLAGDPGFTPVELMDAALAGCLVLSLRIVARKLGWGERLQRVDVVVSHEKAHEGPSRVAAFDCRFDIAGDFSEDERSRLIAGAHEICTVGNTIAQTAVIRDVAAPAVA